MVEKVFENWEDSSCHFQIPKPRFLVFLVFFFAIVVFHFIIFFVGVWF